MRGQEIQERAALGRGRKGREPAPERRGIPRSKGVEGEGRQGKLVDHVGLIPLPKVGDVLLMRNVGFRHEEHRVLRGVKGQFADQAQGLHQGVGFRKVNAGRPQTLVEIGHRIKAHEPGALGQIEEEHPGEFQKHPGVGQVQINLIFAKGGPDVAHPPIGVNGHQQGRGSGTHHGAGVRVRLEVDEVVLPRISPRHKIDEPEGLPADVVQDKIHHQLGPARQPREVFPGAQLRVHGAKVHHGKAVIGGGGKEGKHMHRAHQRR